MSRSAKFTRFFEYTEDELAECGRAFCEALSSQGEVLDRLSTEEWTELVLNWFAAVAAEGHIVDTRAPGPRLDELAAPFRERKHTYGEFLVDLSHSTYPSYVTKKWYRLDYWDEALRPNGVLKVQLALESEWGKTGAPAEHTRKIMEDACKLPAVRATTKVLVYGALSDDNGGQIRDRLSLLRGNSDDLDTPWLGLEIASSNAPTAWLYRRGSKPPERL